MNPFSGFQDWIVKQGLNILFVLIALFLIAMGLYWLTMKKAE